MMSLAVYRRAADGTRTVLVERYTVDKAKLPPVSIVWPRCACPRCLNLSALQQS
jgi:hypothetical protein